MCAREGRQQATSGFVGSRRRFLAGLSAAAAAAWIGLEGNSAEAVSSDSTALPTISLGKHQISRLVAGSNPILGYSYMGPHADQHMKEYFTVERTAAFLGQCERAGITAHQLAIPDRTAPYVRQLRQQGSRLRFLCLDADRDKLQATIDLIQPIAIVHHGGATDKLFAEGKADRVHDYIKAVHDRGLEAGMSAHNPDCIQRAADEGWEVDFFMTCFYFLTRKMVGKDVEVPTLETGYPFFKGDPKVMTQVIRQVKQPCLAFKILGAGRLCSSQETVREAFRFAFANIKPIDGVIVGMFPWYFDEVSANAGYVRQLGQVPAKQASSGERG